MHIEERKLYQISCFIDRRDMRQYGVSPEDFVNRTPLAQMLIKKARELSKESTDYQWPDCAFSMEIKLYNDMIELVFSERIEDFMYNLEQTVAALPKEQADELRRVITMIQLAEDEELARKIIKNFETSVKDIQ